MQKSKLMNSLAAAAFLAGAMTASFAVNAQAQPGPGPGAPAASAGAAVTDDTITASAKTALSADAQLAPLPINVTTRKGVVVVSGDVPSAAAGERVLQIVAAVSGVKDVKSALKVKGSS
jgi:hyperosmotically inducible protein